MALEKYLQEEVALDHADGYLSRREALRRLAYLGLAAPAAVALLAACARDEDAPSRRDAGRVTGRTEPAETEDITLPGSGGRDTFGTFAAAEDPKGAVLVIHENRGLTDHIKSVAGGSRPAATPRSRSTCCRPAAARRSTPTRPRSCRLLSEAAAGRPRRRHDRGDRRARAPRPRREDRRDRVLLRRRHGLAAGPVRRERLAAAAPSTARRRTKAPTSPTRRPRSSASTPSSTTG